MGSCIRTESFRHRIGSHRLALTHILRDGIPKEGGTNKQQDDIGVRRVNPRNEAWPRRIRYFLSGKNWLLVANADGLGSKPNSKEAARIAIEEAMNFNFNGDNVYGNSEHWLTLNERLYFDSRNPQDPHCRTLTFEEQREIFPEANIFRRVSQRIKALGDADSTLLLDLYFQHKRILYRRTMHVGDCRRYEKRKGKLTQTTFDHTIYQMIVDAILNPQVLNPVYAALDGAITEMTNPNRNAVKKILAKEGVLELKEGDRVMRFPLPIEYPFDTLIRTVGRFTDEDFYQTLDIHAGPVISNLIVGGSDGLTTFTDFSGYDLNEESIWVSSGDNISILTDEALRNKRSYETPDVAVARHLVESAYQEQQRIGFGDNISCYAIALL